MKKSNLLNFNLKDLKKMNIEELEELASLIRSFLIESITKTGGHLGPNLGVVELTIALHYVFCSPEDQIIFDIGHQAYPHKILTSRAKGFSKLRKEGGVSGFVSYEESPHDVWESGHAGTSLSAMMGSLLSIKNSDNPNRKVVAVIGDGALSSGMSLEALNLIGYHQLPGIIIINNNKMSISKSIGQISNILNSDDFRKKEIFFKTLGYKFTEIDGHNLKALINVLNEAKDLSEPVVILANTIKGKGLKEAEEDRIGYYHNVSPKGAVKNKSWGNLVVDIIEEINQNIETKIVIPAMEVGTGFIKFKEKYPNRILDVGISEEHAATMSASLAKNGENTILSLYSTFSQRAFDQILNDIARPNLPVTILIDRAGIISGDGDTHQGIYDVAAFDLMPNTIISEAGSAQELRNLLYTAITTNKPFIVRYPKRDIDLDGYELKPFEKIDLTWTKIVPGKDINIITSGEMVGRINNLIKNTKLSVNLINARFIKPIDELMLKEVFSNKKPILVIEEYQNTSGLYSKILDFKEKNNFLSKVRSYSLLSKKISHGTYEELLSTLKFSDSDLLKIIKDMINETR